MTAIETAFQTDGLVCLCRSYRGISIKWRLLHNQLKVPCRTFQQYI